MSGCLRPVRKRTVRCLYGICSMALITICYFANHFTGRRIDDIKCLFNFKPLAVDKHNLFNLRSFKQIEFTTHRGTSFPKTSYTVPKNQNLRHCNHTVIRLENVIEYLYSVSKFFTLRIKRRFIKQSRMMWQTEHCNIKLRTTFHKLGFYKTQGQ